MNKSYIKDLKEMIALEKSLREERGFDDQDVQEVHETVEEMKSLFRKLGQLTEESEFLKEGIKLFKPFKKIKFNKGKNKFFSVISSNKYYLVESSLAYESTEGPRVTKDADIIFKPERAPLKLLANVNWNWTHKGPGKCSAEKIYGNTYVDIKPKKGLVPKMTIKEITVKDFPAYKKWGYLSPEFKRLMEKCS